MILAFPEQPHPVRALRSTVIVSSLNVLRATGNFERYAANLPADARELLVHQVAAAWIPLDLAMIHYAACDALGLTPDQVVANGRAVFDRTSGSLLGTALRMAREVGASPWTVLPHLRRFWDRAYDGGAVRVVKTGPKEARAEAIQARMCESVYYRHALRGLLQSVVELFCLKAYVVLLPERRPAAVTVRVQWA